MGASGFTHAAKGKTAKDAFNAARTQAQYDYGHAGYTGTIAEKHDFVVIALPKGADPEKFAYELLSNNDQRVRDKWGPAGCIPLGKDEYLFFGFASC